MYNNYMSWNYRVFNKQINGRDYFYIKEVFYDNKGDIISFTEDTETGYFEDVDHLEQSHQLMLNDIKKYRDAPLIESDFQFN